MKAAINSLAALSLCLTCVDIAAAEEGYLTAAALRALFKIERTVRWEAARSHLKGVSHYRPDGITQTAWSEPARSGSDAGHWRISENQLCIKYRNVHGGRERCYRIRKVGPRKLLAVDSEGHPAFTYFLD